MLSVAFGTRLFGSSMSERTLTLTRLYIPAPFSGADTPSSTPLITTAWKPSRSCLRVSTIAFRSLLNLIIFAFSPWLRARRKSPSVDFV